MATDAKTRVLKQLLRRADEVWPGVFEVWKSEQDDYSVDEEDLLCVWLARKITELCDREFEKRRSVRKSEEAAYSAVMGELEQLADAALQLSESLEPDLYQSQQPRKEK